MITKKHEQNPRKKINRAMGKPHFTNKFCWKTPKNDNATCKLILNSFTVHTTTQQPYAVTTKYYSTTGGFCRGFPGDRSDRENDPENWRKVSQKALTINRKGGKKRDSNNLFWTVKATSVSFVLWLFNEQQNTNSRPLFPNIFCFLLFPKNELTKWKHTPPPQRPLCIVFCLR